MPLPRRARLRLGHRVRLRRLRGPSGRSCRICAIEPGLLRLAWRDAVRRRPIQDGGHGGPARGQVFGQPGSVPAWRRSRCCSVGLARQLFVSSELLRGSQAHRHIPVRRSFGRRRRRISLNVSPTILDKVCSARLTGWAKLVICGKASLLCSLDMSVGGVGV